jgi:hypothetical protein
VDSDSPTVKDVLTHAVLVAVIGDSPAGRGNAIAGGRAAAAIEDDSIADGEKSGSWRCSLARCRPRSRSEPFQLSILTLRVGKGYLRTLILDQYRVNTAFWLFCNRSATCFVSKGRSPESMRTKYFNRSLRRSSALE